MPWLPFYCSQNDLPMLLGMLDDDIAFIVPNGKNRWRAVAKFTPTDRCQTILWHVPSGSLPSGGMEKAKPDGYIDDPWTGWEEDRTSSFVLNIPSQPKPGTFTPTEPLFGLLHPGVFRLTLRMSAHEPDSTCGISSFEWIGNQYSIIGRSAPEITNTRWKKLRRQVAKVAEKIPRGGLTSDAPPEIWAFPNALENLEIADKNPV